MNPTDARKAPKIYLVQVPVTIPVVARTRKLAQAVAWQALIAGEAWRYITRDRAPQGTIAMQIVNSNELSYNAYPRHIMPITDESCEHIVTLRQAFIEYKRRRRIDIRAAEHDHRKAFRRAKAAKKRRKK